MRVFIGSSSEAADKTNILLNVAEILRKEGAEPIAWNNNDYDLFPAGNTNIENLETIVTREKIGASIFIYSEDDKIWWRDKIDGKIVEKNAPRDNVLFEHGLFSGILGRKKSIIVKYGKVDKMPSDLCGVTYIDLSDENQENGIIRLKQWVKSLLNEDSGTGRTYCKDHAKFVNEKEKIETELEKLKTSGLVEVFNDQESAVSNFKSTYKRSDIKSTKILGIRGENFTLGGQKNWSSMIPPNSYEITILGSPDDDDIIKNRYEAQKLHTDETEEEFKQRFKREMIHIQDILKNYPRNTIYLHNESDLSFRMVFIDDYLFLNTLYEKKRAADVEVMKIHKSSILYSLCEDYFNKIKSNAIEIETNNNKK